MRLFRRSYPAEAAVSYRRRCFDCGEESPLYQSDEAANVWTDLHRCRPVVGVLNEQVNPDTVDWLPRAPDGFRYGRHFTSLSWVIEAPLGATRLESYLAHRSVAKTTLALTPWADKDRISQSARIVESWSKWQMGART